jgi:predicted subunit of tRNA(5-methylaminomethyl-2-thiouridylate) methyltransferase
MNEATIQQLRDAAFDVTLSCDQLKTQRALLQKAKDLVITSSWPPSAIEMVQQRVAAAEAAVRGKAEVLRLALGGLE